MRAVERIKLNISDLDPMRIWPGHFAARWNHTAHPSTPGRHCSELWRTGNI